VDEHVARDQDRLHGPARHQKSLGGGASGQRAMIASASARHGEPRAVLGLVLAARLVLRRVRHGPASVATARPSAGRRGPPLLVHVVPSHPVVILPPRAANARLRATTNGRSRQLSSGGRPSALQERML
jgi:hypothetical protein